MDQRNPHRIVRPPPADYVRRAAAEDRLLNEEAERRWRRLKENLGFTVTWFCIAVASLVVAYFAFQLARPWQ